MNGNICKYFLELNMTAKVIEGLLFGAIKLFKFQYCSSNIALFSSTSSVVIALNRLTSFLVLFQPIGTTIVQL